MVFRSSDENKTARCQIKDAVKPFIDQNLQIQTEETFFEETSSLEQSHVIFQQLLNKSKKEQ